MLEEFVLIAAGGLAAFVLVARGLRWLAIAFLPDSLAGPGGFLIDTRGRLGIFDMHDRDHRFGGSGVTDGGDCG